MVLMLIQDLTQISISIMRLFTNPNSGLKHHVSLSQVLTNCIFSTPVEQLENQRVLLEIKEELPLASTSA